MKRLWTLLGRLVLISMAVNLAVELFSRKSLSGLGGYVFGSPLVFLLNVLLTLIPFLLVFFIKRKILSWLLRIRKLFTTCLMWGTIFPGMMLPAWMMPFRVSIPASRKLWPPFCRRSRFLTAPIRTTEKSGAVP